MSTANEAVLASDVWRLRLAIAQVRVEAGNLLVALASIGCAVSAYVVWKDGGEEAVWWTVALAVVWLTAWQQRMDRAARLKEEIVAARSAGYSVSSSGGRWFVATVSDDSLAA